MPTGVNIIPPSPASGTEAVRLAETDGDLSGVSTDSFLFDGLPSACALAFISSHLNFQDVVTRLQTLAGATPIIGISTAGELCTLDPGAPLYRPMEPSHAKVVLQIFSPKLIRQISIHAVPLHNQDIRSDAPAIDREERVRRITAALSEVRLPFHLDARDSLALTFVDGLSACENYLMEAVYQTGQFPCLFVGGSAGGKLDFRNTYLFDGRQVLENHAVIVFVKLAAGKRYGVLKSQNFQPTGMSFIVVDADPDRRTVTTVLDSDKTLVVPVIDAIATALQIEPAELADKLSGHTFGIMLDGELFVRSVSRIDLTEGVMSFYCDVNQGDVLELLIATDFVEQTKNDVEAFLHGKPPPLAVLLNDCVLRRLNNEPALNGLTGLWSAPTAGFSTFGELLGININQTLTAVVFFDAAGQEFWDDFVDSFPIHYARFSNYFTRCRLHRIEILNSLRAGMTKRWTGHLGASPELTREIENMMTESADVRSTLEGIRAAISREVANDERARHAEQQLNDAIETINDGFAIYDCDDRLVLCNSQYKNKATGAEIIIQPGRQFADMLEELGRLGSYCLDGAELESFLAQRLSEHQHPTGKAILHPILGDRWIVSREFRTQDGGVVATRTDVTELKRREEEVNALKRRYELILQSAGDGIIGIDADASINLANSAACHMLGATADALAGRDYRLVLCGHPDPDVLPPFPLADDEGVAGEGQFILADGGNFTAEFVLAPIRENGGFRGAVLVFRDISLRKQYEAGIVDQQKKLESLVAERTQTLSQEIDVRSRIERALRDSQKRLLAITASLFEGVLLVDVSGIIVFANKSAHRWLDAENLAERELDEVLRLQSADQVIAFADSPFHAVIVSGETIINDDAVFLTAAGRRVPVAYATSPLDEGAKQRIAVISFRSIEMLKEAQRDALQSSRLASVGQLAAGIAHEINTPIQYVGDNLRFIRDALGGVGVVIAALKDLAEQAGKTSEMETVCEAHEVDYLLEELPLAAQQSLQGVEHVAHIVRSMKEFSHPGATAKVAADINRAIDSTLTVSRNEWKHVATVETDLDPNLPPIICFPAEINQVLLNLIVNAAHAIESTAQGHSGIIQISTRKDGASVEIRVADSGPGVPNAIQDKIFDPFFTTKTVGKGTGQGLAVCRDVIANKHGGKLFLDSSHTGGAMFVVRLPISGES